MSCAFTPSRCHINLGALTRNFHRLGAPARLMPVIKSDAYGHGLLPVAAALDKAGALHFAVGGVDEGKTLRDKDFRQEIVLLMGCLNKAEWLDAIHHDLTPLVGSLEDLKLAASALSEVADSSINVALKFDTGMSRLGFCSGEIPYLIHTLENEPGIKPAMLLSHFACADMPEEECFTQEQLELFLKLHSALIDRFPGLRRSLGNSAGTIGLPQSRFEISRPGYSLYGGNPFKDTELEGLGKDFEWVMSLSTPIIHVRDLKAGQSVSYGRIFKAPRAMRVAVAGCGYATGFSRVLSGKSHMLINGRRAPQIGRVCMSMSILDVSDIENVKAGDRAWIMGGAPLPGEKAIDAGELASLMGTIPYEILCSMGALNPRVYSQ